MFSLFRSKIYIALLLLLLVLTTGVLGYRYVADYTWIDALYMTIITVTTVGFREVNPIDDATKIFTMILIVGSVFIFAYAISIVTEYIFAKNALEHLKNRKMKKKVERLTNHVIICGYGRNGMQAAKKLKAYQKPFVVIEHDQQVIETAESDILFVCGNASEDQVLLDAGIENARCLITALPNDSDNLFIVLSARQLKRTLTIISRASEESSQKKLRLAGADKIIMPDKIGGDHMASLVVLPDLTEFLDNLSIEGENTTNIEEVCIEDIPDQYRGKNLVSLDLRNTTGCTVIGYKKPDGTYIINPDGNVELLPKSKLIVLGRPEQIIKLNALFEITENHI